MRQGGSIFAGPRAVGVMVFYYLIPFLIVAGGSDSLAKLRPFRDIGFCVIRRFWLLSVVEVSAFEIRKPH